MKPSQVCTLLHMTPLHLFTSQQVTAVKRINTMLPTLNMHLTKQIQTWTMTYQINLPKLKAECSLYVPLNTFSLHQVDHFREDFTEYIPLVLGGHHKNLLLFIIALLKITKYYEIYMEKIIRKHTRPAPKQFIGPLRLWSP